MLTLRSCASRADVFVSANLSHLVPVLSARHPTDKPTLYTTANASSNPPQRAAELALVE
jgi:hypothetical protein